MIFNLSAARERLPGRQVRWFDRTPSTMIAAAQLARGGCPSGTVVGADEQTAGIGRHGRSWHSEAGAGLYVSIVLRLSLPGDQTPLVMLALGLAARDAIARSAPELEPDLRWPNDVLIGARKCAGILAQWEGDAIIAGIGINVSQSQFPKDLETPATSLKLEGATTTREDLLIELVQAVEDSCRILTGGGGRLIVERFTRASSYAAGRRVRAHAEGRRIEGVTRGLDSSGFLRLLEDNGRETTILAGGVRPLEGN